MFCLCGQADAGLMLRPSGRYHLLTRPAVARQVLPADTSAIVAAKMDSASKQSVDCDTAFEFGVQLGDASDTFEIKTCEIWATRGGTL